MKKLLFAIFLAMGLSAHAQFTLNTQGKFINSENKSEYKVYTFAGKSKAELREMIKENVRRHAETATYLTLNDSDAISIQYEAPYQRGRNRIDMTMTMKFGLKEGKVRVSGAWTEVKTPPTGGALGNVLHFEMSCSVPEFLNGTGNFRKRFRVWNTDGTLESQENLDAYSNVFNTLIGKLMTVPEKEEEW